MVHRRNAIMVFIVICGIDVVKTTETCNIYMKSNSMSCVHHLKPGQCYCRNLQDISGIIFIEVFICAVFHLNPLHQLHGTYGEGAPP